MTMGDSRRLCCFMTAVLAIPLLGRGDDVARFVDDVRPLLVAKCVACHGAEKQEGGLRLDSIAAAVVGGDQGPAIVPGDTAKSLLLTAISFRDPNLQMPPKQKLSEKEIATLTEWVSAGAVWPEQTEVASSIDTSTTTIGEAFTDSRNPIRKLFRGERLDLWSLQRPAQRGRLAQPSESTKYDATSAIPAQTQYSTIQSDRSDTGQDGSEVIDTMIRDRLAIEKLEPASEADPRTLVRRLTFDLTGLPPTPDDVASFERECREESPSITGNSERGSTSADSTYVRLVERLLSSSRYGERQARLWLDVVRYADTHGYERDEFRPLIWRYRDYVVRSFNQDQPFDQFIRAQLAGDEMLEGPPQSTKDTDRLIATGFLRLGQWDSTASIFQEEPRLRAEMMADLTNTTASAFLGLTYSCCQCHDHKYDPFSQADHFRLRAFFAGLQDKNDTVVSTVAELAEMNRHNGELDARAEPYLKELALLLDPVREQIANHRRCQLPEDVRQALETDPANRDESMKEKLKPILEQLNVSDEDVRAALDDDAKKRQRELTQQIDSIVGQKIQPLRAMTVQDSGPTAPATHLFYQGDFLSPREEVWPGFPSVYSPGPADVRAPHASTSGRRLALANWIASPDNPWTARVIVNRVWQQHFGSGLVSTPNDFGFTGARPTHPELLDWLAVEFVKQGWSVKKLHRWIVKSATYRQQSLILSHRRDAAAGSLHEDSDPNNTLLARQNIRRLDAESLRDALLTVSGLLKPYDQGKPLWPSVPDELLKAQPAILEAEYGGDGGRMQGWYADPIEESDVRSLFLIRKRCLPIPFLQIFDLPESTVSCARRDVTVVAPQALMLLNSPEGVRFARFLSARIANANSELAFDDVARTSDLIDSLFQLTLTRKATPDEQALACEFLIRHRHQHAEQESADRASHLALTDLCRAVLNLNEFVYID